MPSLDRPAEASRTGPATEAFDRFLQAQARKPVLRFLTCGSVDDGKSTLIGRLLHECGLVPEDQMAALVRESGCASAAGADFSLLLDGLEAEREQNITIDVAYRYFATERRKFIVADTPGHEQYTRNMATGASTADLAVVLVDVRHGLRDQTRRHIFIASLFGIPQIVLAVNKMDLVDYDQAAFERVGEEFQSFAAPRGFRSIVSIPVSARAGENLAVRSAAMHWYNGPSLLEHLEETDLGEDFARKPLRLPVQRVARAANGFRGVAGMIASGGIAPGDRVVVARSEAETRVKRIVSEKGDLAAAAAGRSVTVVLEPEVDCARGDMLVGAADRPSVSDQFEACLVWFDAAPMVPGRQYRLRTETDETSVSVTALKHRIDLASLAEQAAETLRMNDIGLCNVATQRPIVFDPYQRNRRTGSFILVDRTTHDTVGAGVVTHSLRRADNLRWQVLEVDRAARAAQKAQSPAVIWLTGLSGAGKSTIANLMEKRLFALGTHTYLLDGDNVRHGLNRDLGFTPADRVENIRRVAHVARLMADAGLVVIVSFISPFQAERALARQIMEPVDFVEVFVDASFETCARRDPKGLYKRALAGEIPNFTGLDSPYETPEDPELTLRTETGSPEDMADRLCAFLLERQRRSAPGR